MAKTKPTSKKAIGMGAKGAGSPPRVKDARKSASSVSQRMAKPKAK